jgi:hypothetical protein
MWRGTTAGPPPRCLGLSIAIVVWLLAPAGAAAQGFDRLAEGHYQKGLAYYRSKPPDHVNAVVWYRRAAELGHARAQNDLGWLLQNGWGVPRDDAQAVHWYRQAATQGYAIAQTNIGWMYQNGRGVPRDYAQAVKWYRLAAAQGDALAQNNIGVMYRDSLGVYRDLEQAFASFRKAAAAGDARAQQSLRHLESRQRGMDPWPNILAGKGVKVALSAKGMVYLFAEQSVRLPSGNPITVDVPIKIFTDPELRDLGILKPDGSVTIKEKPNLPYKPMRAASEAQKRRFFEEYPKTAIAIHWPPYVVVASGVDKQPPGSKETIREAIELLYER